ncbi:hypothetical protein ABIE93_001420 [Bradyrhizobium elkanii]|uniref:hypothetical protein n=1 Tax=Bradyrhizobium elkanii TaxID=29448 RepID=UPI0035166BC9
MGHTSVDASAHGSVISVLITLDPGVASTTLNQAMTEAEAIQHDNEIAMAFILSGD